MLGVGVIAIETLVYSLAQIGDAMKNHKYLPYMPLRCKALGLSSPWPVHDVLGQACFMPKFWFEHTYRSVYSRL